MIETLKQVIKTEMDAIALLLEQVGETYEKALDAMLECRGKIVFMGVGKSGHIGKKLAATFASTGTPSFFVHAEEAMHGDLGMIESRDVVVLISNSGTTKQAVQNLPWLKKIGCKTIAFTSNPASPLAKGCDMELIYPKLPEADHLNLAPTVSTTLTLVLGDALACALSKKKNFTRDDFYNFHPSGALGQLLNTEKETK